MRSLAALALVAAGTSCRPPYGELDAALDRGKDDLSCAHVEAYRAVGGTVVTKGCGRWIRYACVTSGTTRSDPGHPVCTKEGGPFESETDR